MFFSSSLNCFADVDDRILYDDKVFETTSINLSIKNPLAAFLFSSEFMGFCTAALISAGIVVNTSDDIYDNFRVLMTKLGFTRLKELNQLFLETCKMTVQGEIILSQRFKEEMTSSLKETFSSDTDEGSFSTMLNSYNIPYYPNVEKVFPVELAYTQQDIAFQCGTLIFVMNYVSSSTYQKSYDTKIYNTATGSPVLLKECTLGVYYKHYTDRDKYCYLTYDSDMVRSYYDYGNAFNKPGELKLGSNILYKKNGEIDSVAYAPGGTIADDFELNDGITLPKDFNDFVGKNDLTFPKDNIYTPGDTITFPGNPSLELDNTTTLPVDDTIVDDVPTDTPTDTPTDSIWENIKAFIISLVVPADTFWTDTFGGLRGSFESAFPMVDMDNFKLLAVGGKPFPNIYVTLFGVKCKIVDGDIINSIVDWLRPLIAGFMMLCLMLFNYRKIYKLIRNTEPFGPIASGTSDFRTGMSPSMDSGGFSAYDIARDQIRDVMFDIRNEGLSRKNNK